MTGAGDIDPPPRVRIRSWVMALVRLGAGWLITARPLVSLVGAAAPVGTRLSLPLRLAIAAALGLGLLVFAWPRTYLWGLGLLLAGLAAVELLGRSLGLPPTPRLASAAAILAVLAAGEWLTQRVERRR